MRRPTKSKSYKKLILFPGLLLILIVLILGFLKYSPLKIKDVEVKADRVDCANSEELKTTTNLLGQNILLIDKTSLEKKLKGKYLCVRKIKIEKNLPSKIILSVSGRQPAAILVQSKEKIEISTSSGETSLSAEQASSSAMFNFGNEVPKEPSVHFLAGEDQFLIDDEGVIFSKEGGSAPKIYFEGISLTVGKKLEEGIVTNTLKILDRVKVFGVEVSEAKIYSQNTLLVNSTPKMIFSLNLNLDLQLAALQLLLEQAKINEENMEFVDLRFEKPIVKYAPKKKQ